MLISALVFSGRDAKDIENRLSSVAWTDEVLLVLPPDRQVGPDMMERLKGRVRIWAAPRWPVPCGPEIAVAARHDWLLWLAEDESLGEDAEPVLQAWLDQSAERYGGLALPRFSTLGDRLLTGPDWYPDHRVCLFNRKVVVRPDDALARQPMSGPPIAVLNPPHCLHIHRHLGHNLRDYLDHRLNHLLSLSHATDSASYDWANYLAQAQEVLAEALEAGSDGDLGQALKLLSAWEILVRGLLHWDSLVPQPPLNMLPAFPMVVNRLASSRIRLRRVLFRHRSIRFQARLSWAWLQSKWWRLRGY
jgi:hypothetical protein